MKKLIKYLNNYKKESIIGPLFKLLEACFELVVPLVMTNMIDVGIKNKDTSYILRMGLVLVILGVLGLICSLIAQYFAAKAAVGFGTELRHDLFSHIGNLSFSEIDIAGTSTLVTRMTSDINYVQSGVNLVLRLFLRSPFIVVGALVMAFLVNSKIALIFLLVVPVLGLIIYGIMMISIPLYKKVQKKLDKILHSTRENLAGIRVVRAFRVQQLEQKKYEEDNISLVKVQLVVGRISALLNPITYVIVNIAIIAVIWFGGKQVNVGNVSQGEIIALINYMSQILIALIMLANLIIAFTKALSSASRINEIFALKTSIKDGVKDIKAEPRTEEMLSFEGVSYTYKGAQGAALSDITFHANRGESIGIIGGTGAGKSTLVHMIPRFYDATKGEIKINGTNIKEYSIEKLRKNIGIVPQKAVLFRGSVRENLSMGNANATDSDIYKALEIAQALEIIENKEQGLDLNVNQGGANLSGGQRQRLTIGRALVREPDILILDDSASALDFSTDAKLRNAIIQSTLNMTVFIVSQRVVSVMRSDKIIVLDDGHMVGMGTHTQLLDACEIYKEICYSQLSKEEVVRNE